MITETLLFKNWQNILIVISLRSARLQMNCLNDIVELPIYQTLAY